MPIEDVGYRGWRGRRMNSLFSWFIMVWSGMQIARRSVWVRRALVVAWIPAVYLGAGMFFFENMAADNNWREFGDYEEMFIGVFDSGGPLSFGDVADDLEETTVNELRHRTWSWLLATFLAYPQSVSCLLLIGLIAPPLISRDMRSKAFLIYFSKPIGRTEYLAGKFSILALFLMFITFVPALGLYVFGIFLSPNLSVILDTWDLPFRVTLACMIFVIPTASVALMFSSLTTESRYAAFAWFAYWGLGYSAWQVIRFSLIQAEMKSLDRGALPENVDPYMYAIGQVSDSSWSLVSLYDSLVRLQSWVLGFNDQMNFPMAQAVMVSGLTLVSLVVLVRRVSAPIRI